MISMWFKHDRFAQNNERRVGKATYKMSGQNAKAKLDVGPRGSCLAIELLLYCLQHQLLETAMISLTNTRVHVSH